MLSSLRPAQLFGGKVLAYGALGLLQLLVWLLGILLVLQRAPAHEALSALAQFVLPPGATLLLLLYFVLAYLMFAGAFSILGALSASMREGPQYAAFITLPAVSPLWVSAALVAAPHDTLALALSLFPLTAPLTMLQRVLITEVPLWQIALSVALQLLSIAALMWLAGRLFRVQTPAGRAAAALARTARIAQGLKLQSVLCAQVMRPGWIWSGSSSCLGRTRTEIPRSPPLG